MTLISKIYLKIIRLVFRSVEIFSVCPYSFSKTAGEFSIITLSGISVFGMMRFGTWRLLV